MALFFRDDTSFQVRQTGFARYRQLLSFYGLHWLYINLFTTAVALPLAGGILLSVLYSSSLMLIPLSLLGGALFGPFLAGLFDAIMRGHRVFVGVFTFMFYVMMSAGTLPGAGTLIIYGVAVGLFLLFSMLYWPQLVLFEQKNSIRLKNAVLFMITHSKIVLGMTLLQMGYLAVYVFFAPWTVMLAPFLGLRWVKLTLLSCATRFMVLPLAP